MENVKEFIQAQIDDLEDATGDTDDITLITFIKVQQENLQHLLLLIEEHENAEPEWTYPAEMITAAYDSLAIVENIKTAGELNDTQLKLVKDIKENALGLTSFASDMLWKEMQDKLKWDKEQKQKKKTAAKKEGEK